MRSAGCSARAATRPALGVCSTSSTAAEASSTINRNRAPPAGSDWARASRGRAPVASGTQPYLPESAAQQSCEPRAPGSPKAKGPPSPHAPGAAGAESLERAAIESFSPCGAAYSHVLHMSMVEPRIFGVACSPPLLGIILDSSCDSTTGLQVRGPDSVVFRAQAIAEPGLGDQITRLFRVGLELAAQVLDADPEASRVVDALRAPDLADELALGDNRAEVPREAVQHAIFEWREMNFTGRAAGFALREIELEGAQPEERRPGGAARSAAQ